MRYGEGPWQVSPEAASRAQQSFDAGDFAAATFHAALAAEDVTPLLAQVAAREEPIDALLPPVHQSYILVATGSSAVVARWSKEHGREHSEVLLAAAQDKLAQLAVPESEAELFLAVEAVRARLTALRGQPEQALFLMLLAIQAQPGLRNWHWILEWPDEAAVIKLGSTRVVSFLAALVQRFMNQTGEELTRLGPLIDALTAPFSDEARLFQMRSSLRRRMGRLDEALDDARKLSGLDKSESGPLLEALVHADRGELDRAVDCFRAALARNPDNLAICLDLGDRLCAAGRFDEGLPWYQRVLDREPEHPWAYPHWLYYRWLQLGEDDDREQLYFWARFHDDERDLAAEVRLLSDFYGDKLPDPMDATANLIEEVAEKGGTKGDFKIGLSSLEAPSNLLMARIALPEARLVISTSVPEPDPRVPLGTVKLCLWRYEGADAVPAVAAPDAKVASEVAWLAAREYSARSWLEEGQSIASRLRSLDGVAAAMVHPPPLPHTGGFLRRKKPAFSARIWVYRVQHAAAFILAGGGEAGRAALYDLARGPMDWTVDSALVALTELGREEPALRGEVLALLQTRIDQAPKEGHVCYLLAAAVGLLRLPAVPLAVRDRGKQVINRIFAD
jgi:tetratricopeptide (TPR) repeat protein